MEEKFLKVTQKGRFFDKHKAVLIAVSGGKDSMNLLHLLYKYQAIFDIRIGIAHVNHQQRQEALEEEHYIKEWAQRREIPFYVSYFEGKFSEEAARTMRYDFFAEVMKKHQYTALVTAHHADDQAETILMRLIRGSRLVHLAGMKIVQPFAGGEVIRPLLSFRKSELMDLVHFEDESNDSPIYFRNRVRNNYLPLLMNENPQFSSALLHVGKEADYLHQALRELTSHIDIRNLSEFQAQTEAVRYFLLQQYLEQFPELHLTREQFQQVLGILATKANYQHHLKGNYYLIKDYQTFIITKIQPKTDRQEEQYVIESEGVFQYGRFIFSLNEPLDQPDQILYLQANHPIVLRGRTAGDTILLHSINKKVRRYFIDQKIPQKLRNEAVVIEQAGKIYGIANMVASDLSKSAKSDIIKAALYIKMKE
ncbi:tRNA lysidine(34) synthetase TilS [Streptococcus sp. 19428wC2_LYSM12]|uniref:tRNA lysidine(34) synthetase TilS n=1 Tax=unclassified Streptococcus TaxID=2608887 RepID=UPI001071C1D4|nr:MULTISPECIES: tRNA lysidine(34) synthetase TilS [unclassified Streptococcus]MBF0786991.1 tRNA lysidine(34) synthetase TilS [Streptococcus sp. 19428wC2_LYSM12]TFV06190.1 tRNA lysidine(34) synthetase TilS [Streptococcus sp. LYSM12]